MHFTLAYNYTNYKNTLKLKSTKSTPPFRSAKPCHKAYTDTEIELCRCAEV